MSLTPFHVAVPVRDLEEARRFYGEGLGLPEGRSAATWIDFDLFGHQFVVHLVPDLDAARQVAHGNPVDGHDVPVPHCGVVLTLARFAALAERVRAVVDEFVIPPHVRFQGEVGEQHTMFFLDPSGNALEFKAFADIDGELFRSD